MRAYLLLHPRGITEPRVGRCEGTNGVCDAKGSLEGERTDASYLLILKHSLYLHMQGDS